MYTVTIPAGVVPTNKPTLAPTFNPQFNPIGNKEPLPNIYQPIKTVNAVSDNNSINFRLSELKSNPVYSPQNIVTKQDRVYDNFNPIPLQENVSIGINGINVNRALSDINGVTPFYLPVVVPSNTVSNTNPWQDLDKSKMSLYSNGVTVLGTLKMNKYVDGKSADYHLINYSGVAYNSTDNPNPHPPLQDLYLNNVIISIKQRKNTVETKIMGHDGSIIEYLGLSNYDIKLEGVILGSNGVYPINEVQNLKNFLTLGASIYINCPHLYDTFNISYITIKDFDIEQKRGGISQQEYTIDCSSDNLSYSNIMMTPYQTRKPI